MNLTLLILTPDDQNTILELLDDIEELNQCYDKLGINKVQISNKKVKLEHDEKKEDGEKPEQIRVSRAFTEDEEDLT